MLLLSTNATVANLEDSLSVFGVLVFTRSIVIGRSIEGVNDYRIT